MGNKVIIHKFCVMINFLFLYYFPAQLTLATFKVSAKKLRNIDLDYCIFNEEIEKNLINNEILSLIFIRKNAAD